MHQGHNIPWEIIASNFEFKENNKHFTPAVTALFSRNRPNGVKELKHFISRFIQAIRMFSETERAKYSSRKNLKFISEGNIFSDDVRKKYPKYLNAENQRIENWIARAKYHANGNAGADITSHYTTQDGDLADVVKILLHENEMEMLLMMANHPQIPLSSLHNLGWGHSFGFSRVMDSALRPYMFFNSAEATGILEDGRYAQSHLYPSLLRDLGVSMDYPAQQVPHQEFFRSCGVYGDHSFVEESTLWERGGFSANSARQFYVHQNHALLHEYTKTLFSLLYRYDMIMQECGLELCWELEIGQCYPIHKVIKIEQKWVEETRQWVYELC